MQHWYFLFHQENAQDDDDDDYISCTQILNRLRRICIAGKNLVVPERTFGTGAKARRTEWCALCIFLSIWIPVYIIMFMVCIVIYQSSWIEGMSVQTSYVNTLAIPSLIFCPKDFKCGITASISEQNYNWSQIFPDFGHPPMSHPLNSPSFQSPPPILPTGQLNLTFSKLGHRAELTQVIAISLRHHCDTSLLIYFILCVSNLDDSPNFI